MSEAASPLVDTSTPTAADTPGEPRRYTIDELTSVTGIPSRTIRFYQHILGLEVLERKVSPRGSHLAFLKVPNSEELIELCSFPASGPVTVQEDLVHLAFQVENLDDNDDLGD